MQCPDCYVTMTLIDKKLPPGYDPELREFKCPKCGKVLYKIPIGFESLLAEVNPIEPPLP